MKETSVENQLAAFPLLARSHAAGWELFVAAHGNISYHKAWTYPSRVCVPTSACLCTRVQVCTLTASASFSPDIYAHVAERTEPGCAQACTGSGRKYRGTVERGRFSLGVWRGFSSKTEIRVAPGSCVTSVRACQSRRWP